LCIFRVTSRRILRITSVTDKQTKNKREETKTFLPCPAKFSEGKDKEEQL